MVRCMKNKNKTIDEYIVEAKNDIYAYILIWIIFFLILLYLAYRFDNFYLLFIDLVFLLFVFNRIIIYGNLMKIKEYLVKNKLINKIGKIDCWSEKNYLLTENYVIIVSDNMVNCFKYDRIKKIRKQVEYNFKARNSNFPDYLYLILNDDTEYKIEITEISIMSKKYCDISSYILEKNKAIIIEETIVKINNHKL